MAHRIIDEGRKGPPVTDEKRRCAVPQCGTKLSVYNPAETCRVHTKPILNKRWRDR